MKVNRQGKSYFILISVVAIFSISSIFIYSSLTEDEKYKQDFLRDYRVYAVDLPDKLTFAGEEVPLGLSEVRERLDREMLSNVYWQSNMLLNIKRAYRWFPVIVPILKKNGIPEDFKYIVMIESNFQNVTSPSGAVGFWQFMESTAKLYGLTITPEIDERYDLVKATEAACKYFRQSYNLLGSWTLTAASFNMGAGGIKRQVEKQQVRSFYDLFLNTETSRYIFRILAVKEIYEHPQEYGFYYLGKHLYKPFETYFVEVDTTIPNLVDFAFQHGVTYRVLRIFNPWIRDSKLTNKERKTYIIELPKNPKEFEMVNFRDSTLKLPVFNGEIPEELLIKQSQGYFEDSMIVHTVKKTESVYSIAKKYNVRVAQILQWNELGDYYVKPNQKLKIFLQSVRKIEEGRGN